MGKAVLLSHEMCEPLTQTSKRGKSQVFINFVFTLCHFINHLTLLSRTDLAMKTKYIDYKGIFWFFFQHNNGHIECRSHFEHFEKLNLVSVKVSVFIVRFYLKESFMY